MNKKERETQRIMDALFGNMILSEYYAQKQWLSQGGNLDRRETTFEYWSILCDARIYRVEINWSNRDGRKWNVYEQKYRQIWGEKRRVLKRFALANRKLGNT